MEISTNYNQIIARKPAGSVKEDSDSELIFGEKVKGVAGKG